MLPWRSEYRPLEAANHCPEWTTPVSGSLTVTPDIYETRGRPVAKCKGLDRQCDMCAVVSVHEPKFITTKCFNCKRGAAIYFEFSPLASIKGHGRSGRGRAGSFVPHMLVFDSGWLFFVITNPPPSKPSAHAHSS